MKYLLTALIAVLAVHVTAADNLTPPAGAISNGVPVSTMKTLNEIEPRTLISALPYTIDRPGSYYLAMPLTGTSVLNGINITVGEVKVDLNGFSITGIPNSGDGIEVTAPCNNITIRNGIIRNWGRFGLDATNAAHVKLVELNIYGNDWGGAYAGKNALVRDCAVYGNGYSAPTNDPPLDDGIMVGPYSTITDCKVYANVGAGIHTFSHSRITGCTATESVQADGIHCEDYCTVRDCTVARNRAEGIKVGSMCRVTANTCGENGFGSTNQAAGILIIGQNSFIADNNVCANFWGIKSMSMTADGNLIVRNVASNNTNAYYFVAGDHIGPVTSPPPGNIPDTVGPWANFNVD